MTECYTFTSMQDRTQCTALYMRVRRNMKPENTAVWPGVTEGRILAFSCNIPYIQLTYITNVCVCV